MPNTKTHTHTHKAPEAVAYMRQQCAAPNHHNMPHSPRRPPPDGTFRFIWGGGRQPPVIPWYQPFVERSGKTLAMAPALDSGGTFTQILYQGGPSTRRQDKPHQQRE